jgi:UDPglucose 6-dehydrogenase
MQVGFVGLGNLGFPIATAMQYAGHNVIGYDKNPDRMNRAQHAVREVVRLGDDETDFWPFAMANPIQYGDLDAVVQHAEIVFICVQTPHDPRHEGVTPIPAVRQDFNYEALTACLKEVFEAAARRTSDLVVSIISTVLPGTTARILREIGQPPNVRVAYNPSFCAMGTTVQDFLSPEFVLIGTYNDPLSLTARDALVDFYSYTVRPFGTVPIKTISAESAELAKVSYNTFISAKIGIANIIGEICHKIPGANADEVTSVLAVATRRLLSPSYLTAGMGDGGACHPRDNIAMSWLAEELGIHYDIFDAIMMARQQQAWLFANMIQKASMEYSRLRLQGGNQSGHRQPCQAGGALRTRAGRRADALRSQRR